MDQNFGLAYHQLALVYEALSNPARAREYHKKAREKGYTP